MSEGVNRVMLLGRLGADPELRHTQTGGAVMNLRLATTERVPPREGEGGEWTERTEWHRVVVWGKRAEALAKILGKGDSICVEGSLRTSSYEKAGERRYSTDIVAQRVILTGGRGQGRPTTSDEQPTRERANPQRAERELFSGGGNDDDIPF